MNEIAEAEELGKAWAVKAAKVSGLTCSDALTAEETLAAINNIVVRLISAVEDLSLERGEEFAKAFEAAARREIGRQIPRSDPQSH